MASETGIFSTAILLIAILFFFFRCLKIIYNKRIELYNDSYEYALFVAFFVVNFLTFFPLRSSGSFFSNFSGSLIWLNFSFLFIYLKHFESILKKKIKT
jgi:O-antigen ligase